MCVCVCVFVESIWQYMSNFICTDHSFKFLPAMVFRFIVPTTGMQGVVDGVAAEGQSTRSVHACVS